MSRPGESAAAKSGNSSAPPATRTPKKPLPTQRKKKPWRRTAMAAVASVPDCFRSPEPASAVDEGDKIVQEAAADGASSACPARSAFVVCAEFVVCGVCVSLCVSLCVSCALCVLVPGACAASVASDGGIRIATAEGASADTRASAPAQLDWLCVHAGLEPSSNGARSDGCVRHRRRCSAALILPPSPSPSPSPPSSPPPASPPPSPPLFCRDSDPSSRTSGSTVCCVNLAT
mmetsp:Transcript_3792/g.7923  ORF Transcript_3792/g.7923 Transcript_3792/m.7923 type:complete len:232 (+) Transcript_3792:1514-2209(+)|eukprot:3844141-Pleurochrysis_carterae.AAC.4